MDISVAIGRNVDNKPMPLKEWKAYKVVVWAAVALTPEVKADIQVEEDGTSKYFDPEQGKMVQEQCYRIIATIPDDRAPQAYLALRDKLNRVRRAWHQWGIALSMVKTDMVMEEVDRPQYKEDGTF